MPGTLESSGINGSGGTTAGDLTSLGYTWIGNNANGNPSTAGGTLDGIGLNKVGDTSASLSNESDKTNDTHKMAADQSGTVESRGING